MNPKHKHPIIPIEKDKDPFENCKLDRKKYAISLNEIIDFYSNGFVMAVNNKWGTGKTTFIKMWKQLLMNEGFKTIYFNAWENDFQDDVIIALLAEIGNIKGTKSEVEYKSVLKKAKPLIGKAGLGLIKGLLKKIGADEMLQAIIDGTAEVTIDGIEKEIDNYTNRKKGIEGFREELEKLALSIGNDKPLIFIIDELDRCRPNYAVEVLEKIKHLYSVPGIVFILAIDKEQLSHAIKGVYGSDKIDAKNYLRRFIDIEYTIPDPSLKTFIDYLFSYYNFEEFFNPERNRGGNFKNEQQNFKDVYLSLFTNQISTLRVHEKKFAHIRLLLKTFKNNQYSLPEVFVLLIFLKEYHQKLYRSISNKDLEIQDLLNELNLIFINKSNKNEIKKITFAIGRLIFCYYNYLGHLDRNKIYEIESDSSEKKLILNFELNQANFESSFESLSNHFDLDNVSLKPFLSKVELLDNLK